MNKQELIKATAGKIEGATQKQAAEYVEAFLEAITDALASGEEVNLSGFARFSVVDTPAREARNPKTGETVLVEAGKKVKVKVLKGLKDAVSGK